MTRKQINSFLLTIAIGSLLGGCVGANKQSAPIPRRGDVVAQGSGMLSFRAPGPGLVSVYDLTTNSVITSTAVDQGSVVAVNPTASNITETDSNRNGTQIVHTSVDKSHRYELWFIPRTSPETGAGVGGGAIPPQPQPMH